MSKPIELDFADKAELEHFLQEVESAALGQIPTDWLERSYMALSPTVKAVVAGRVYELQPQTQKENP